MTADDPRWWLNLPPCPRCSKSHVLIDCTRRLPWEVASNG
jgi:hypothetical protein